MCQSGVAWGAHCSQVPREAVVVPHVGSQEAPIATVDHGGQGASVVVLWIFEANTVQAVCGPELSPPNGPSRACAARLVPL